MKQLKLVKQEQLSQKRAIFSTKFENYYRSAKAVDNEMLDKTTPSAVHGLTVFSDFLFCQQFKHVLRAERKENKEFRVLFDGYSTPFNAVAMHEFLIRKLDIDPSKIVMTAIDLEPKAMEEAVLLTRQREINFSFRVADASNLPFPDGHFFIILQDFLLNCAPHSMHQAILSETARVLDPKVGVVLLGWTSLEGLESRRATFSIEELGISRQEIERAFRIKDLTKTSQRKLADTLNSIGPFLIEITPGFIFVSADEDFEFYKNKVQLFQSLQSSLTVTEMKMTVGMDRHQNVCWRHRIVACVNPEESYTKNNSCLHHECSPHTKINDSIPSDLSFPVTFAWEAFGKAPKYEYARISNPIREELEIRLARLENGKRAFAVSSGQAAALLVFSILREGDHAICFSDVHSTTLKLFDLLKKFGIKISLIHSLEVGSLDKIVQSNTKMIFLETPSSPLFNTLDVRRIKKSVGEQIFVIVDSTVATPIFQRPLEQGADVVLHSLTKFIAGRDNSTGGAIITNDERLIEELFYLQCLLGISLSPYDCFLTLSGLETLELRMKKHTANAKEIVRFLSSHNRIENVNFPGFGGLLSFSLIENAVSIERFFNRLSMIKIAQSYGGPQTTVHHPLTMLDSCLNEHTKWQIGLRRNLIRLAVGLEDPKEIILDLKNALE